MAVLFVVLPATVVYGVALVGWGLLDALRGGHFADPFTRARLLWLGAGLGLSLVAAVLVGLYGKDLVVK